MRIPAIIKDISASTNKNHNGVENGVRTTSRFNDVNPILIERATPMKNTVIDTINSIIGIILGLKPQPVPIKVEPQRFSKLG